jgi:hypothetical protein
MTAPGATRTFGETLMSATRVEYTKADVRELRAHSKAKTAVKKIAKTMKRSEGSLRQKASIVDKSCAAWNFFADDPERVASITSRTWATVNP